MMNRKLKLTTALTHILGDEASHSLGNRINNGISFLASLGFFLSIPLAVVVKTTAAFLLHYLFFSALFGISYLLSRFRKLTMPVTGLMIIGWCSYISFLWFFYGGSSGSAVISTFFLVVLISPLPQKKQRRIIIAISAILLACLYLIQYSNPQIIKNHLSIADQFIVNYIIFIFVGIITALLLSYILNNYRKQEVRNQKAKQQIKKQIYHFKTLADTTSSAIILCQGKKVTFANPAAENLYGYPAGQLTGRLFSELITDEYNKKIQDISTDNDAPQKTIPGGKIKILPRSGKVKSVFFEASSIDYNGAKAWLVSMIDLTRLQEARTNLFNLQNYLATIIDSMPSILVGVNDNMKITQWNRQAVQQMQLAPKDVLGQDLFSTIPRLNVHKEIFQQAIAQKKTVERCRITHHKGGHIRHEEVTVYPLVESGFNEAVIRMDDVSEKIQLEKMVIQSEKMLSIGGLAAGMAHEINNPLAGIMQNVQLARNRLTRNIPVNQSAAEQAGTSMDAIGQFMRERKILNQLDSIRMAGGKAAKIVENMLIFARKGIPRQPYNLADLLNRTIELTSSDYNLKEQYDFKQIKIKKIFSPEVPKVLCEENKIMQVFFNILTTAAKAASQSDHPELILRLFQKDDMVHIEIEDNGPGMSHEVRKKIFKPFFTTNNIRKGAGLGLSLSYFIVVKDHNGRMHVESAPQKGSKFIISLPCE